MSTRHTLTLFAISALLATACGKPVPQEPDVGQPKVEKNSVVFPANSPQLAILSTQPASAQEARLVRFSGRLVWDEDRTVRVSPPFSGRVVKLLVQPGDKVAAGQDLAVIASPDFGQVQADAQRAQADLAVARDNLTRMRELAENGVAAQKEVRQAETDFAKAEAEAQRAAARLDLYGRNAVGISQELALRSPIAGVVVEKNINLGQELRPDQPLPNNAAGVFVITDPTSLWVILDAHESELPVLKNGQSISVQSPAWPEEKFRAQITHISDFVDPSTRTVKVRGHLDNPAHKLKGEMFVFGEVHATGHGIEVPSKAVFLYGTQYFVFSDDGNGRYTRREVKVGPDQGGFTSILSGLTVGQPVVVSGVLLLDQILRNSGAAQ